MAILLLGPVAGAMASEPETDCDELERAPEIRCSPVVTVAAASDDEQGLWRLWVDLGRIWIQQAGGPDAPFDEPRPVNSVPEPVSTGAENRPRLLIDGADLTVVWARPGAVHRRRPCGALARRWSYLR